MLMQEFLLRTQCGLGVKFRNVTGSLQVRAATSDGDMSHLRIMWKHGPLLKLFNVLYKQ